MALVPTALSSGNAPFSAGNDLLYYTWSTTAASIVSVDSTGAAVTAAPGLAVVTATSFQSTDSVATGATGDVSIEVVPGTLTGTLSTATGVVGSAATVTAAAGDPPFLSSTVGTFDLLNKAGVAPAGFPSSATQFSFTVPPNLTVGSHSLVISGIGPDNLAQEVTFTVSAGADADLWESDVFGLASPPIVMDGRYFTSIDPVDVDDFFLFDNSAGAADMDLDIQMDWDNGGVDVDIVFYDANSGAFTACGGGCSGAKPEHSVVSVPAGAAWVMDVNFYSGPAQTNVFFDVTIN
jgi:hypothetical protein